MRVRAVAVASDRSNAVGPVEVDCTDDALVIVHRGVAAFQPGYAPAAMSQGTVVRVPWESVREAGWDGDRLYLHVDPALTPHHRLLLSGFQDGDAPPPGEARRRRLLFRVATGASAVTAGLLVVVTLARFSEGSGAASLLLLGALGAGVILATGLLAEGRLGGLDPDGERARTAFAFDLSVHLPGLQVASPPRPSPSGRPFLLPTVPLLLPRSTTLVVITLSAALLAAVLTANWLSRSPPAASPARALAPPRDTVSPETKAPTPLLTSPAPPGASVAATPAPAARAVVGEGALLAGSCTCTRADSVLWRDGLPRVSTLLIERQQRAHNDHVHTDLELGVVNNSDAPIPEISLVVQFFERAPGGDAKTRVPTFERPLYFAGPLVAGQAIKWHVEARGNDFEVSGAPGGRLDPSQSDSARAFALVELLRANHRPVRLHGAMMLAYLGDPRAREGALGLREALREEEAPYIDRLLWALSDVRTCEVKAEDRGPVRTLRACVFNASKEPKEALAMRMRALDHAFRHDTPVEVPPLVVAERVLALTGKLAPGHGAYATATLDTTNADGVEPGAFEIYADRADLVF